MMWLPEVLSLLLLHTLAASSTDLSFSCSIVHNISIATDRRLFSESTSDEEYEEVCIVVGATINSTGASVTFPSHRSIELFYPAIPFIGPNLFRQLNATTVHLELRNGSLEELYYGLSRLECLKISHTGLRTFDVLPETHRSLHTLVLHEGQIVTVPANIRYLVGLRLLDLSSCALTTVDLAVFAGIRALRLLNLADNRLTTVGDIIDEDVVLPKVTSFDVGRNQLTAIDRFPAMFPALQYTSLVQNRWECEWVSDMRQKVWDGNITVLGSDGGQCAGRTYNGGLCCEFRSPSRARLALTEATRLIFERMQSKPERSDVIAYTLVVYENVTVDGVVGMEMDNVGVYLQDPINEV